MSLPSIKEVLDKVKQYNAIDKYRFNLYRRFRGWPGSMYNPTNPKESDGLPILARMPNSGVDLNIRVPYLSFKKICNQKAVYAGLNITESMDKSVNEGTRTIVLDKYYNWERQNNVKGVDVDVMKACAGWGVGYILLKVDKRDTSNILYKSIPAWRTKIFEDEGYGIVYERKLSNTIRTGERWVDEDIYRISIYDESKVIVYSQGEKGFEVEVEESEHGFTDIPIIEFCNNVEMEGNAERSIEFQDAYDIIMSDCTTEVAAFRLAYLIVYGNVSPELKKQMEKTGAIPTDKDGKAPEFLTKNINPEFVSLMRDIIWEGIWSGADSFDPHAASKISDPREIQVKQFYKSLDDDVSITETCWQKSYFKLDTLLRDYWVRFNGFINYEPTDVVRTFGRAIITDDLGKDVQFRQAGGMLSNETLIERHYPGLNAAEEAEKAAGDNEIDINEENMSEKDDNDEYKVDF